MTSEQGDDGRSRVEQVCGREIILPGAGANTCCKRVPQTPGVEVNADGGNHNKRNSGESHSPALTL